MTPTRTIQTNPTAWDIDPDHSAVEFSVKHLMFATVRGRFRTLRAVLHVDPADPAASRVEADVDVASIDTGTADRDNHLRSADFFDAANHPTMTFRSTRVEPQGPDRARVTGDLTIRGTTRPLVLDVARDGSGTDPWGNPRTAYTATGTLDRRDHGLTWNQVLETGGFLVGDTIQLQIHVEAVARKPPTQT